MSIDGLQKVKDSLSILDVYMTATEAYCADDFDPKRYNPDDINYQFKHLVTGSQKARFKDPGVDGEALFKVFIEVGCRFVPKKEVAEGKEEPIILAKIDATMVAEYVLSDAELDEDSLKVFALSNASYHVWPFWREYLMNMCTRMNLPKVAVPTFQVKNLISG